MADVGVSENRNNFIFSLRSVLGKLRISDSAIRAARDGESFDAVLIGNPPPREKISFNSKLLIVPDCMDASKISPDSARNVISYGLRRKNTVTASSLIGNRLVVSLQREIPTLGGKAVDEQEFSVCVSRGEHSDKILGVITTLLALDVPVSEITKINFDF